MQKSFARLYGLGKLYWIRLLKKVYCLLFTYNVVSHELELDVPGEYKTAVKQMVDNYKPSDVKLTCPVKMTIIPNCTNIAFTEHPSRSSAAEREKIRKQVEE